MLGANEVEEVNHSACRRMHVSSARNLLPGQGAAGRGPLPFSL